MTAPGRVASAWPGQGVTFVQYGTGRCAQYMDMMPGRLRGRAAAVLYTLVAGCTAANVSSKPDVYTMSSGRVGALVAAFLGLTGVAIGGLALAGSARRPGRRRPGAIVALIAGLTGMVVGGLVVGASDGGVGTGNGVGGAVVALVVGLVAMVLGGLALARSRRTRATG